MMTKAKNVYTVNRPNSGSRSLPAQPPATASGSRRVDQSFSRLPQPPVQQQQQSQKRANKTMPPPPRSRYGFASSELPNPTSPTEEEDYSGPSSLSPCSSSNPESPIEEDKLKTYQQRYTRVPPPKYRPHQPPSVPKSGLRPPVQTQSDRGNRRSYGGGAPIQDSQARALRHDQRYEKSYSAESILVDQDYDYQVWQYNQQQKYGPGGPAINRNSLPTTPVRKVLPATAKQYPPVMRPNNQQQQQQLRPKQTSPGQRQDYQQQQQPKPSRNPPNVQPPSYQQIRGNPQRMLQQRPQGQRYADHLSYSSSSVSNRELPDASQATTTKRQTKVPSRLQHPRPVSMHAATTTAGQPNRTTSPRRQQQQARLPSKPYASSPQLTSDSQQYSSRPSPSQHRRIPVTANGGPMYPNKPRPGSGGGLPAPGFSSRSYQK